MIIAVPNEYGQIFRHFGRTSQFKFYEAEDNKVNNVRIESTNGQGHGALAGFLKDRDTDILICGGIGGGAQTALKYLGIEIYAGNSGSADEAVQKYLSGELVKNENATCGCHGDHSHEEKWGGNR
jgi:predicted Fe-Mo cluster-binding NifX family protein